MISIKPLNGDAWNIQNPERIDLSMHTPSEHLAAYNRTPRARTKASVRAASVNPGNDFRLGKFSVPDETIAAMVQMRDRGRSFATIGRLFGLSPAGARNRVLRRAGA